MSISHINFSNYMNKDCSNCNTQNGGVILSPCDVNGLALGGKRFTRGNVQCTMMRIIRFCA